MFELSEQEQLEEHAMELTQKHLDGKQVDVDNRKIHWSSDMALSITQCAKQIDRVAKTDQPITIEMFELAIMGWLEVGDYYPDGLSEQQQSDLDDEVWQWIEDHDDAE